MSSFQQCSVILYDNDCCAFKELQALQSLEVGITLLWHCFTELYVLLQWTMT